MTGGSFSNINETDEELLLIKTRSTEPDKSYLQLFGYACIFAGIQFGWALQIAYTTPIFNELGVSKAWLSYIWLAGPISGFIVQPIAGSMSDRCESNWGRRRPFMLGGTIMIVVGLLLISNAALLGQSLGTAMGMTVEGAKTFAIVLGVIGFWILDFANNAVQGPCRAMVADKAPNQQPQANAILAICLSIGNISGYVLGWQGSALLNAMPFMKTSTRILFTISCIFLLITCIVTCIVAKERKHHLTAAQLAVNRPIADLPKALFQAVKTMPKAMVRVCIVQFFSWIAYFTFLIYMQSWMSENVYGGLVKESGGTRKQQALYKEGVEAGSLGLTFQAAVTLLVSMALPRLMKMTSIRKVYSAGLLCLSLNLISTFFIRGIELRYLAIGAVAFNGIPWAVVITIPFTLVAESSVDTSVGVSIGVMNLFVVIPQLFVSLVAGPIVKAFDDASVAMLGGGFVAIVAACCVYFLIIPDVDAPTIDRLRATNEGEEEDLF